MNRKSVFLFFAIGTLLTMPALAAQPDASIVNTINAAMALAANQSILPKAIVWLSSLMALQFVITNFGLIKSGADIEAVIGKLIGSFAWFGFCGYLLMNGPDYIDSVGNDLLNTFAANLPSPGSIIAATLTLCTSLLAGIAVTGTTILGSGNQAIANMLVIVLFTVFSIGMYMAVKILMISLELGVVVLLSPLSFSFLGLNALKDQGIAPLKSLISLAYRIILMGIFCSAFGEVVNVAGTQLNGIHWTNPSEWSSAVNIILSMLCAYPIIAYFVFKSDSIAASLASGSTNMGAADVASAAAMGAAAGSAMSSGASTMTTGAGNVGQSMGDFMKNLMGGNGGSLSNASSRGAGPVAVGAPPSKPIMSMSTGGQSASASASDKAPARPSPTNSGAAPSGGLSTTGPAPTPTGDSGTPASSAGADAPTNASTETDATNNLAAPTASDSNAPSSSTPAAPGASEKAPVRPSSPNSENSAPRDRNAGLPKSAGSGANAAIGAAPSSLEQQVGDLVQALNQPKEQKGAKDHLSELNQHVAQEQAGTHISINTHHSD